MNCPICKTCNITNPQEHIDQCAGDLIKKLEIARQAFDLIHVNLTGSLPVTREVKRVCRETLEKIK